VDANGRALDTIRLGESRELRTRAGTFALNPMNRALDARYHRGLRLGLALSDLDGPRRTPVASERFVRVRELPSNDDRPLVSRLSPDKRYRVTAPPPYSIRGADPSGDALSFADSAAVEVRQGDTRWRFVLRNWRRAPSSNVGLALFFNRNPRPLDTP